MRNIDHRDLIAGLLLLGLGVFVALYASGNYRFGDVSRMGPGFFPAMLGWILAGLGLLIALLSMRKAVVGEAAPWLAVRPLIAVFGAVLVFSLTVERWGLVPATCALTAVAVFAERRPSLRRSVFLAIGLSLLAWLIFTVGLQMALPAFNFHQ